MLLYTRSNTIVTQLHAQIEEPNAEIADFDSTQLHSFILLTNVSNTFTVDREEKKYSIEFSVFMKTKQEKTLF